MCGIVFTVYTNTAGTLNLGVLIYSV